MELQAGLVCSVGHQASHTQSQGDEQAGQEDQGEPALEVMYGMYKSLSQYGRQTSAAVRFRLAAVGRRRFVFLWS